MRSIPTLLTALFALAAVTTSALGVQAETAPTKIGLISDMSSVYADNTGEGSIIAATLAIEDVGAPSQDGRLRSKSPITRTKRISASKLRKGGSTLMALTHSSTSQIPQSSAA